MAERDDEFIFDEIIRLLSLRIAGRENNSLKEFHNSRVFESFNDEEVYFIKNNRSKIISVLSNNEIKSSVAEYSLRLLKSYTYRKNQFIHFNKEYDEKIKSLYIRLVDEFTGFLTHISGNLMQETDLRDKYAQVISGHHYRLRTLMREYFRDYIGEGKSFIHLLDPTVASDYSAQLQLELMKIDPKLLNEPILDIGCGKEKNLIRYLSSLGLEAYGFDRMLDENTLILKSNDWLKADFGVSRWGTIIAHHSFTTNFIYQHYSSRKMATEYAIKYMQILKSLKTPGEFIYTPGLPFIESQIESLKSFEIKKYPVPVTIKEIESISYAVKIKRLQ